ncbi:AAEL012871-PA, partial [Aedes aegypti]
NTPLAARRRVDLVVYCVCPPAPFSINYPARVFGDEENQIYSLKIVLLSRFVTGTVYTQMQTILSLVNLIEVEVQHCIRKILGF